MPPHICQCPVVSFPSNAAIQRWFQRSSHSAAQLAPVTTIRSAFHNAESPPCKKLPLHTAGSPDHVKLSLQDGSLQDTVSCMQVFLEGVKAALTADAKYNGGNYSLADKPIVGLKALSRVYAGELSEVVYQNFQVPCGFPCLHVKWLSMKGRYSGEN